MIPITWNLDIEKVMNYGIGGTIQGHLDTFITHKDNYQIGRYSKFLQMSWIKKNILERKIV